MFQTTDTVLSFMFIIMEVIVIFSFFLSVTAQTTVRFKTEENARIKVEAEPDEKIVSDYRKSKY